ncbi:hypothetical protein FRC11_001091 [Ceratobasidium sp. 423]|nr:hypothetical protein FRC11_001091 [Ceratobasidium sp. 423]
MSNSGHDGASTGHAGTAPSGEPYVRPRSASRMSTASEIPLESTPRPRSNKQVKSSTHISTAQSEASRPSSRGSMAVSTVGSRAGGSVKDAGIEFGHFAHSDEGPVAGEEIPEVVKVGDGAYTEANTGTIGIKVPTDNPGPVYRHTAEQIGSIGLGQPPQVPHPIPTLAPPIQIVGPTVVQPVPLTVPQLDPPVDKTGDNGKDKQHRQDEPSPGAEAKARQRSRRHASSRTPGVDEPAQGNSQPGPSIVRLPPGTEPRIQVIRVTGTEGKHKNTRGETHPQGTIDPLEQTRLDYELIGTIGKNRECLAALIEYEEAMGNGGREAQILFANLNREPTEELVKDKGKGPTMPKNKVRGRVTLGVLMNQLEGEHKPTHTPAPNTVTSKNRGLLTGGYLYDRLANPTKEATATGGNPSDSSDSSSSSDSDSDDFGKMNPHDLAKYIKKLKKRNKGRKEKDKLRKLQLSGFKTKLPTTYNGSNDFDTFEQFVYEVETWQEDTGFEDYEAMRHVKSFLKDKAANYYMLHVAPDVTRYTLTLVFQGLFDYCFPPDSQARIRRKFNNMTQSDRGFRDFYHELCKIQRRLADINDKAVAVRMWEGAHSYIRVEWARNGYSAEHHSPKELEESAIRFETAKKIRQAEENRSNDRRDCSTFKGKHPDYHKPKEDERRNDAPKHNKPYNNSDKYPKKEKVPRLSPEKFAEYRAAGKCTYCHEVGHIAKDCPKRNFAKPKGISTSAVSFACIHVLEAAAQASKSVYAVSFDLDTSKEPSMHYPYAKDILNVCTIDTYAMKKEVLPPMEWNSSKPKDKERKVPQPIVLEVLINGNPARALLDSGSHGDFVSTTLVDQLKLKKTRLAKPIGLQMAVSGSKSSINWCTNAQFQYQGIDEPCTFDVMNIENYDLILGTPFLFQFKVTFGLNLPNVLIGSKKSNSLQGRTVTTIVSLAAELLEDELESVRAQLHDACKDLFKTAAETPLPPFRVINH